MKKSASSEQLIDYQFRKLQNKTESTKLVKIFSDETNQLF